MRPGSAASWPGVLECSEEQNPKVFRYVGACGVRTGEGTSGETDVGEGEGSSKQGVRGATAGCREASDGSCAARADEGVAGSTWPGREEEGEMKAYPLGSTR